MSSPVALVVLVQGVAIAWLKRRHVDLRLRAACGALGPAMVRGAAVRAHRRALRNDCLLYLRGEESMTVWDGHDRSVANRPEFKRMRGCASGSRARAASQRTTS
jgi:hypothetical protein